MTSRGAATDFGLAKKLRTGGGAQSELIGGTLEYAAPEQLEGKDVDPRTDVYSLGCALLFALTGRPPGIGHLWGETESPALPPELEAVISRARGRAILSTGTRACESSPRPRWARPESRRSARWAPPPRGRASRPARRACGRGPCRWRCRRRSRSPRRAGGCEGGSRCWCSPA